MNQAQRTGKGRSGLVGIVRGPQTLSIGYEQALHSLCTLMAWFPRYLAEAFSDYREALLRNSGCSCLQVAEVFPIRKTKNE